MLTELRILNFAILEELSLQFEAGFTILTGETGAGKSLLIDAIALLVGGRASAEHIRHGQDEASLEAAFQIHDRHPLLSRLRGQGVLGAADSQLIVRRVISRSGRNRVYLNGSMCSLHALEELGGTLVDIHGQHDQQSLLSPSTQLEVVDAFGGLQELRGRYRQAYDAWKSLCEERDGVSALMQERAGREEFLRFQHAELEEAALQAGEDEALQQERRRLGASQRIGALTAEVLDRLHADGQGVLVNLGLMERALGELTEIDAEMGDASRLAIEARVILKEVAGQVRDYAERLDADPARLAAIEDRLSLIQKLKKKYGGTIEAALELHQRIKRELEGLEGSDARLEQLGRRIEQQNAELRMLAEQLSQKRTDVAKRMTKVVRHELGELRMGQTVFEVQVHSEDGQGSLGPDGIDQVEFLLSANAGEPPKALSKVASGGELSRVMLALKTVLAERDHVPVLIFDEIDTGVGGAVAAAIGKRLRGLGRYHQVFCITHLPQVASAAHHHLCVEKAPRAGRTVTTVRALEGSDREHEIARMLGGATITKKVRETAAELIAGARDEA
ncbi:MAG: DNA repair protein RecN [Nitrospira sp.]|jgi:DNA repair protein RecN (Recombination protein N)|nr:DNA repair protein RecN [Nitrospira sp.]